jgi:hypothetical protein
MFWGFKMHRYYLDESGNTGDLIKNDFSLEFGNQPLFSLACAGIGDEDVFTSKLAELREKHSLVGEFKSTEIYSRKPNFYLDLAKVLIDTETPFFIELVDKKYCIIINFVSSLIIPLYNHIDETSNQHQIARNHLANYLWHHLPLYYLKLFNEACLQRKSKLITKCLKELKQFFDGVNCEMLEKEGVSMLIGLSIDDFQDCCNEYGEDKAVEQYLPIPDLLNKSKKKSKAKNINILPHVHSFYNIIGRINKFHLGNMKDVHLFHDEQKDFDVILEKSKDFIVKTDISTNLPPISNSDLAIHDDFRLDFIKSESSTGVQVADLLAGFYVRFINDVFYDGKKVDQVYFDVFKILAKYQNTKLPLGVNFVLPYQKQQSVFTTF